MISLKPVYIDQRGDKERMKQRWISGSNFLTNLCLVGMRWPPTSGRRLGPGWRRWRQRATYLKRPLEVNGPRHRHSFFARWKTFKLCGRSAKVAKRDCLLNFTVLYHFSPFERFWSIGPSGILKMAHDSPKGQNQTNCPNWLKP